MYNIQYTKDNILHNFFTLANNSNDAKMKFARVIGDITKFKIKINSL